MLNNKFCNIEEKLMMNHSLCFSIAYLYKNKGIFALRCRLFCKIFL